MNKEYYNSDGYYPRSENFVFNIVVDIIFVILETILGIFFW